MRAVVCTAFGPPECLVVEHRPVPMPGAGEVQVELRAWGVNHVDLLMCAGGYQLRPDLPFVPGLEAAGVVTGTGPGVTRWKAGDRVITQHRPGAFAELVTLPEASAFALPARFDFAEGAAFRSAYHTAYHALAQRAGLRAGETLMIHGASGGVGLAAVHVGRLLGATVIATGADPEKLAVVKAEGADHVVDASAGFRDTVKAITGGRGVDVVYDPVGGDLFDESMRCLAWGARLLVIGFTGGRPASARTNHLLIKGAAAIGIRAGEATRQEPRLLAESMARLHAWAEDGKLRPHISHRVPFSRFLEAIRAVGDRRVVGKAVLVRDRWAP